MVKIPTLIRVEDPDVQRYLDKLRQGFIDLAKIPFLNGVSLTVTLTTTPTDFAHKLGRKARGAFALDGTGILTSTADDPLRFITASTPDGPLTVQMWVF